MLPPYIREQLMRLARRSRDNQIDAASAVRGVRSIFTTTGALHGCREMNANSDFGAVIQDLSARAAAGAAGGLRAAALARVRGGPDEGPCSASGQHFLTMSVRRPARFEGRDWRGRPCFSAKRPGALSLIPAGVDPALRARTDFELVVCALDSSFVNNVEAELERLPRGRLSLHVNIQDVATRQLLNLLVAAADEYPAPDRLYLNSLTHALACRFLVLGKPGRRTAERPIALSNRVLRRIEERMRNLESDLSLQALAKESGYSRAHFSRMFRAATGHSPHNYLLHLRVDRARELLENPQLPLTDIALKCGFSSHSHMTRAFHQFLGVTPTAYRRSL